jgi:hypothetical protein
MGRRQAGGEGTKTSRPRPANTSLSLSQRFSLACLGFSFLFRGVQRGSFSFQRERGDTCAQFDDREVVYSENGAFATTSAKLGDV